MLVNGLSHSVPYSAQQVTSLCSQRTGANLPARVLVVLASCVRVNGAGEGRWEDMLPPYFHEQTNAPYARTRTWQSPLITLLCSFWVSTDKQCDDQRPLIALRGRARGGKDWSVSGKDWKRPGLSTLEMGMKRGKHIQTKARSVLAVA